MSKIDSDKLSRRSLFGRAVGAASVVAALPLIGAQAQPAPGPPAAPAVPPPATRPMPQGGTGPIKVLFITKSHPFDRENLFLTLDSMGKDITWTHVEHPAAQAFFDPKLAAGYDVFLFYDAFAGRDELAPGPDGKRNFTFHPPSPKLRADFKQLLRNGDKGFVFFHHALSSWNHTWPEYVEVMGGASDWDVPLKNIRGKNYPQSGYHAGVSEHITVVDKAHPITQGLGDGFDIVDETYLSPMFEDSVHALLRTDFKPVAENFRPEQAGHPAGSNMTAWVKTAERSPIVYIQHGHDNRAWTNPSFRTLMTNAIKWSASPDSKTWAHANPKKIFS
ncbi:ThuA domain-containing protein [Glacieibacterium sp.]|uniref:ThuA domain-containing protein n=1 Tax=Glacieibacterium sp. TaxID=2860237 RepID=UPI003B00E7AD